MIKITDSNGVPKDLIKRFWGSTPIIKIYLGTTLLWNAIKKIVQNYSFMYSRTGGGTLDADVKKGNIESIKGNTLAWNQNLRELSTTYYYDSTNRFVFSSRTLTIHGRLLNSNPGYYDNTSLKAYSQFTIPANHVIYTGCKCTTFNITTGATTEIGLKIGKAMSDGSYAGSCFIKGVGYYSDLFTPISQIKCEVIGYANKHATDTFAPEDTVVIKDLMLIDLTLIYGSGNEPSTPAQFEADYFRWFGKPLSYEPYDAGSLRNVQMQGLKTIGFNQWDEEWESGRYKTTTGEKQAGASHIRCKNPILVLPNTTYYVKGTGIYVFAYDNNHSFISSLGSFNNNTFTTQSNCRYICFWVYNKTTYNNDICINISDTSKNGTYESYEEHNVSVPVTTLTGKVNGQGSSVVIFPDGMKGVGDVKDEIKVENGVTKAIKRIGRVDLGTLDWGVSNPQNHVFRQNASSLNIKFTEDGSQLANAICPTYTQEAYNPISANDNMCFAVTPANTHRIVFINQSYSDVATFKTAMSGVYLDYELAEPVEYVVDDFNLPASCSANRYGTEEVLPVSGVESIAPTFDITYTG